MRDQALRLGVICNLLATAALSGAMAATSRLFSSGDEAAHVDYAYQVWHGRLPVFENGLMIDPSFGSAPPVQWVAQHPPLYYLFQAPFVGPFADAGHYMAAGMAGRAVNIAIACALVAAVMWACAAIVPRRPEVWLLAGAVAAVNPWVIRVGGSVYNDNFGALWATVLIGVTARLLRAGPSRGSIIAFGLVAAAALGSRINLAVVVAGCAALLAAVWLAGRPRRWGAVAQLAGACLAAGLAWAWFYWRNLDLTGSVTGAHPEYWSGTSNGERISRPLGETIGDGDVWRVLLWVFGWDRHHPAGDLAILLVPLALAALAAVLLWLRGRTDRASQAIVALLAGVSGIVVCLQLWYAAGAGVPNARYLLPVIAPIAIAIGWVLAVRHRAWTVVVVAWFAVALAGFGEWIRETLAAPVTTSSAPVFGVLAWAGVATGVIAIGGAVLAARYRARLSTPLSRPHRR